MSALGVEYGCKYVLHGPDGTRAVFNDEKDEDFVGILGPESSGLDSADVRESAWDAVEEDGGHHGDFFDGRRPIVLQGTIIATGAKDRNEKVNKLKRAARALRSDATLTWQPIGGPEVTLLLRKQQPLRITKGFVKEFQLPMVAANPFPHGTALNEKIFDFEVKQQDKTMANSYSQSGEGVFWDSLKPGLEKSDDVWSKAPQIIAEEKAAITKLLSLKDWKFNFPNDSRIVGVRPTIERHCSGVEAAVKDETVKLIVGGVLEGENQKSSEAWPFTTDAVKAYGGASDTFGLTLTQTQVENAEFGIGVSALRGGLTSSALIDNISMRVYYMSDYLVVTNIGDAPAKPIISITDKFEVPIKIENITTGKNIVLKPTGALSGALVLDFEARSIKLNGTSVYSWLQFTESDWFNLEPGENKIRLIGSKSSVIISWYDTYI